MRRSPTQEGAMRLREASRGRSRGAGGAGGVGGVGGTGGAASGGQGRGRGREKDEANKGAGAADDGPRPKAQQQQVAAAWAGQIAAAAVYRKVATGTPLSVARVRAHRLTEEDVVAELEALTVTAIGSGEVKALQPGDWLCTPHPGDDR